MIESEAVESFAARQSRACAEMAEATPLANRRDIYLRAQATWDAIEKRDVAVRAAREMRTASGAGDA